MPIRPEPVYLTAVISDAVALFRPQVESAGIAMTLELSPELPPVARMDAQRLRQCLSNILSNALKHTGTGSIWIRAGMNPSGQLSICVADTGTGVPDALVERLFEPFHRGPGSHPGTGLGLAISRTLARRMGGDLELVASATGAHFCLTLAIGRATPDDLTAAKHAETGSQSLAGKRFLVVDDIATNRLVAATYLRMMGAEVDEASSGAAALAQIEARPPSLVLLDINMPDLDGVATLHRMRLLGGVAEQIPVVAMTADATEAHRLHYLAAGLDGYVAKPLTPERLAAAIRPHLGEPAAGHDPSSPEVIA